MKAKTKDNIYFLIAALTMLLFVFLIIKPVWAGDDGQHQRQDMNQIQSQGQSQDQANEQSISFSDQASSAIAPSIYASGPCYYGGSGALSVPQISIGGGRQKVDAECEKRELSRLLGGLGETELAVKVACATQAARDTLGDECQPSTSLKGRINKLEAQKAQLLREREIDREECESAKDRIVEGCGNK